MTALVFAVLAVGVLGTIGLTKAQTGAVISTSTPKCICFIEKYDFQGNFMGTTVQGIQVKSGEAHTDEACNTRCNSFYGRGTHVVTGVIAPSG